MSEMRVNTLKDASGSNSMPVSDINQGRAKTWVNLNGTGTVAVRDSFNVSSIVDAGTGNYQAELASPFLNTNYVILCTARVIGTIVISTPNYDTATTSSIRAFTSTVASSPTSIDVGYLVIAGLGDVS